MDAIVPEADGTKITITGETFRAIAMDGELAIMDAAREQSRLTFS